MIGAALAALLVVLPMAPRQVATVHVMRAESSPEQPGFIEALRIQLAGIGSVEAGKTLTNGSMMGRIQEATDAVGDDSSLAVWLERSESNDGHVDFVLYVVGHRQGRALVDVFRLPAADGPNMDRALALKVREVLDTLLITPVEPRAAATWVTPAPPRVATPSTTLVDTRKLRLGFEIGAIVSPKLGSPGTQGGARIASTLGRDSGAIGFEGFASAQALSDVLERTAAGEVNASELGGSLGARLWSALGPVRIGAGVGIGARLIQAEGTTAAGAFGADRVLVPNATAAANARFPVASQLELQAAVGLDVALRRQRFSVNDIAVLDLGASRTTVALSLVFSIR